jgi:hypothetical protein
LPDLQSAVLNVHVDDEDLETDLPELTEKGNVFAFCPVVMLTPSTGVES